MVYNSMDSRVTSWSGCLLLLGGRLVLYFSRLLQLTKSPVQRHNGMESRFELFFPQNVMSSNPVMYALLIWINFMSQSDTALRHIALLNAIKIKQLHCLIQSSCHACKRINFRSRCFAYRDIQWKGTTTPHQATKIIEWAHNSVFG